MENIIKSDTTLYCVWWVKISAGILNKEMEYNAGILEQSMGARNRVGIRVVLPRRFLKNFYRAQVSIPRIDSASLCCPAI
jgi:hypothetical protein